MVLPRSAIRGFSAARLFRSSARPAARAVARRGYASGHGHSAPSSDVPWILGAAAVTIPGAWYLWPDSSHGDVHGPGSAHAKHVEEHPEVEQPEEESQEQPEDESKDDGETKDEGGALKDGEGEKTQDQPQANNEPAAGESKSKPNTEGKNMPESKGNVEGVQFKGKTNEGDEDNEMPDERKREPDSKGAFKKRIDSGYGKNLGEGPAHRDDGSTSAATAKTTGSDEQGDIQKKQQGLSTTPTRHSTRIDEDPEKSKKGNAPLILSVSDTNANDRTGEGAPETAKSQGTVSVNRPTPESRIGQEKGEKEGDEPRADKKEQE
ncbi:hypothetical protein KCU81_g4954, partial [Aureobasidium melanogenum]